MNRVAWKSNEHLNSVAARLRVKLAALFASLDAEEQGYFEERLEAAAASSPAVLSTLRGSLQDLGMPK